MRSGYELFMFGEFRTRRPRWLDKHIIGIRSDFLFPAARVRWLAEQVSAVGEDATYVELDSPHGHDAFLKEWEQMNDALNVMKE